MSLGNFTTINLPYGMKKTGDKRYSKWFFFNRKRQPLGVSECNIFDFPPKELAFSAEYKNITEKLLLDLANNDEHRVLRDDDNKINTVYFYSDDDMPNTNKENWDKYITKLEKIKDLKKNIPGLNDSPK